MVLRRNDDGLEMIDDEDCLDLMIAELCDLDDRARGGGVDGGLEGAVVSIFRHDRKRTASNDLTSHAVRHCIAEGSLDLRSTTGPTLALVYVEFCSISRAPS